MKRPHFTLTSFLPAGRHCHPLGLLLAGLLVVAINQLGNLLTTRVGS
jgi:hypothetical protein